MAGRPLRQARQMLRNGEEVLCQHKDGCDKPATHTAVAQMGSKRHTRLLCIEHSWDAVAESGPVFFEERLRAQYGRFRKARTHRKCVGGPTKHARYAKYKDMKTLRVAVAVDSPLSKGDRINVVFGRFDHVTGFAAVLWGSASLVRDLGSVKAAPDSNVKYRYAYIDFPEKWDAVYASITRVKIDPSQARSGALREDE
jgi:hypothetical protein